MNLMWGIEAKSKNGEWALVAAFEDKHDAQAFFDEVLCMHGSDGKNYRFVSLQFIGKCWTALVDRGLCY